MIDQVVADNELGGLKQALEGKFVEPGPGGDPIRNPKVLPTGKNIHALDPQSIPTAAALQSAKVIVERLLERQKNENGGMYPETVALVLWGTDNIKTYGESLAQVFTLALEIFYPRRLQYPINHIRGEKCIRRNCALLRL